MAAVCVVFLLACAALFPDAANSQSAQFRNVSTNVYVWPNQRALIQCSIDRPIFYCSFNFPDQKNSVSIQGSRIVGHDQSNFMLSGNISKGECALTINVVRENYNGIWSCTVVPDGVAELRESFSVTTLRKPGRIELKPPGDIYTEYRHQYETVQVQCIVHGGRPAANLSWFIDNRELTTSLQPIQQIQDNSGSYVTIQNFTGGFGPEDHGRKLICAANHPAYGPGDQNATSTNIFVEFQPQRWESSEPQNLYNFQQGAPGTINVTVRANPEPKVMWTVPTKEKVTQGSRSSDHKYQAGIPQNLGHGQFAIILKVNPIEQLDVDNDFSLSVSNSYGQATYSVKIFTTGPPADGLSAGAIVGIVIGIPAFLLLVALLVFARATGRWCFKPKAPDVDRESQHSEQESFIAKKSDTESTGQNAAKGDGKGSWFNSCFKKEKAPDVELAPTEANNEEEKPAKTDPDGVVYAELDLKESTGPIVRREEETTEYAEIIGTVKSDE